MGKAEIISESGSGLYTVKVLHSTTAADELLIRLNASLANVNDRLTKETSPAEIGFLKIRKTAIEKHIARVNVVLNMDYQTSAWCADLTEGLSGTIGTIEPGTDYKNGVNIQPGHNGNAAFNTARDGQAVPFGTMGVADAMRNFAIMPGIQKHRPTYRYATITAIDEATDTCTVIIEPTFSSVQDLSINMAESYSDVPIEYMTCNSAAFDVGDDVIVKWDPYNTTGQPKVIGFDDEPKPCALYIKVNSINGFIAYSHAQVQSQRYQVMLTQPVATPTEVYTIIGSGYVDDAGVAAINLTGNHVDPGEPLHVWLKNDLKFHYYTEDVQGSPDYGVSYNSYYKSYNWVSDPTGDLSGYAFLLDQVWGHRQTGLDLRLVDKSEYIDGSGNTVDAWPVSFTGVTTIKEWWYRQTYDDIPCDRVLCGFDPFDEHDGDQYITSRILTSPGLLIDGDNPYVGGGYFIRWNGSEGIGFECVYQVGIVDCYSYGNQECHKWYVNFDRYQDESEVTNVYIPALFFNRDGTGLDESQMGVDGSEKFLSRTEFTYDSGNVYCYWQSLAGGFNCGQCGSGYEVIVDEEIRKTPFEMGADEV